MRIPIDIERRIILANLIPGRTLLINKILFLSLNQPHNIHTFSSLINSLNDKKF